MRSRFYQWKCLLLAVLVFCTGLYIETAKTVSVFQCASVSDSDAYILAADHTYDEAQLCTAETVGVRGLPDQQGFEGGKNISKRTAQASFDIAFSDSFPQQRENIPAISEIVESEIPHHQEIIANYIHRSDGKK